MEPSADSYLAFCLTLRAVQQIRRPDERKQILSDYFESLSDSDRIIAMELAFGGANAHLADWTRRGLGISVPQINKIAVGYVTMAKNAAHYCEIDYELVFKPCHKVMGGIPETIEKLLENVDEAREKSRYQSYRLADITRLYSEWSALRSQHEKDDFFNRIWSELHPIEVYFFLKSVRQGVLPPSDVDVLFNSDDDTELEKPSLHVVLLYIKSDMGVGRGLPTEMTVGIRVDDMEGFTEEFVPIGKISQVLPDEQLSILIREVKPRIMERFGPTLMLSPSIVLEVKYETLRENRRTKAGHQVENVTLVRIRTDLDARECHTLKVLVEQSI